MIRTILALTALSLTAFSAEAPLQSLFDPGVTTIAGVHVDRALLSPLGRYLLSQVNENDAEFLKFIERTGFDPRRDVREILVASTDRQRKHGLLVARGVFDGPRIMSAVKEHGGTVSRYNGVDTASGKPGQLIAIIDGSLALMGEEAMVKYAIDHRGDTALPATALGQKSAALAGRYDAWAITTGALTPPNVKGGPLPNGLMLQGIVETSGGVELGSLVRVSGEAVTRSARDAQSLVDVIRFMVTMVRNNGENNPDIQRLETILNSLEITAEAATVKVSVAIPETDLEQWIKPRRRMQARAAR